MRQLVATGSAIIPAASRRMARQRSSDTARGSHRFSRLPFNKASRTPQWLVQAAIICVLAGCATVPQTPLVAGVTTEVVKIPVNVRCVSLSEVPQIPKTRLDPDKQSIEQMVIAIQLDFNNMEDYIVRADAILRACATEPQPLTDKKPK